LQCPYYVHKALLMLLSLPHHKVRVVQTETGGAFDPNYRAAVARPAKCPERGPRPLNKLLRVEHTGWGFAVTRIRSGAAGHALDLDLGAVGKGFALDGALAILKDWAVDNVLLHAGMSTASARAGPGDRARGGLACRRGIDGWEGGRSGPRLPEERGLERVGNRGQGGARRRSPDRPPGPRAPGRLGGALFGGGLGRPLDGVHGHADRRSGQFLRSAPGGLGPRENRAGNV
jgi:hypothetical protein